MAGIINLASSFEASTNAELTLVYGNVVTTDFRDITTGYCGPYAGYSAVKWWDFCTGVGVDKGEAGK